MVFSKTSVGCGKVTALALRAPSSPPSSLTMVLAGLSHFSIPPLNPHCLCSFYNVFRGSACFTNGLSGPAVGLLPNQLCLAQGQLLTLYHKGHSKSPPATKTMPPIQNRTIQTSCNTTVIQLNYQQKNHGILIQSSCKDQVSPQKS